MTRFTTSPPRSARYLTAAALVVATAGCGDDSAGSGAGAQGAGPTSGPTTGTGAATTGAAVSTSGSTSSSTTGAGGADGTMSFFVTSAGNGPSGGDFGGLAGADARCQALAAAVNAGGKTWRAYLSSTLEDAADRIGGGPWFNQARVEVASDLADLHASGIDSALILDESGAPVPTDEHDILTGSTADGALYDPGYNCADWTSSATDNYAWVGHSDWSLPQNPSDNWNATHETPCDQAGMANTLSTGRIYCFAID